MINTEITKPKRLLELDSLRGVAALMVVLFHVTGGKSLFRLGMTGVELFFMISGFVILMTLEKVKTSKDFILGRFIRLYPIYWVCITITSFAIVVTTGLNLGFIIKYLSNLTMFQLYLRQGNIDGSYWTLIIEMIFYIFMLFIYNLKALKKLELIGLILLIPLLAYGSYLSYHVPLLTTRVFNYIGLANFFPLFLSGITFYNLKFGLKTPLRYFILLACYCVQLTLLHVVYFRIFDNITIIEYAIILAFFNIIFLLYVFDKLQFIANPVTVFLGNISYALYLIHQYISVNVLMPFLTAHINFWLAVAVDIIIIIAVAYVLNSFVDRPISKYLRGKLLKHPR